mgnify:FL=1
MLLKVILPSCIRKIKFPESLEELHEELKSVVPSHQTYVLQYRDREGDVIVLGNQWEFKDFVRSMEVKKNKTGTQPAVLLNPVDQGSPRNIKDILSSLLSASPASCQPDIDLTFGMSKSTPFACAKAYRKQKERGNGKLRQNERHVEKSQEKDQEAEVHFGVVCDGCDATPIIGSRYKCKECDDFDYCSTCYNKWESNPSEHFIGHTFRSITHRGQGMRRHGGPMWAGRHRMHPEAMFPWQQVISRGCCMPTHVDPSSIVVPPHEEQQQQAENKHYASSILEDIALPDHATVSTSANVCKIWKVQNTGETAWPPNTRLYPVSLDLLGGPSDGVPVGNLPPHDTKEIALPLAAPTTAGTVTTTWQLGQRSLLEGPPALFGEVFTVNLCVEDAVQEKVQEKVEEKVEEKEKVTVPSVVTVEAIADPELSSPSSHASQDGIDDDYVLIPHPFAETLKTLKEMGFDHAEQVEKIVMEVNGDLQGALQRLLGN